MQMINEQIGSYTLKRELGRGGMGVIYAAEDQTLQRQVAIKIMLQSTGHDALQRFHVEMKAIARLNHKHIVHLYSYGEAKIKETALPNNEITFPYIVMPLYKDGSLDKWLQKAPPLTLEEIAHIISQAADALQHAHDNGIVHRDVKPPNFLLSFPTGKMLPDIFLADFGIAKIADATNKLTQTGHFPGGSAQYAAPEQWKGLAASGAIDQYSLAIMTYYLLTGSFPFQGPNTFAYMNQHLNVHPPTPSSLKATITPEIDTIILKALAKDPQDRFSSVLAFANVFQQAIQILYQPTAFPVQLQHQSNSSSSQQSNSSICPNCSFQNRPGAKFCKQDGAPLTTNLSPAIPNNPHEAPMFSWPYCFPSGEVDVLSPNGLYFASGDAMGQIRIWKVTTGTLISISHEHASRIEKIEWAPQSNMFASSAYGETTIVVWDVMNSRCRTMYHGHTGRIYSMAWTLDGSRIASSAFDESIQIWNPFTGIQITAAYNALTYEILTSNYPLAWSPDGKYLSYERFVWDITTGAQISSHSFLKGLQIDIVQWLPDDKCLAYHNQEVFVRDSSTGNLVSARDTIARTSRLRWSPDGKYIASVNRDLLLLLWGINTDDIVSIQQTRSQIAEPDGKYLALFGWGQLQPVQGINTDDIDSIRKTISQITGKYPALVNQDELILVWDISTGNRISIQLPRSQVTKFYWSPDGKYLAAACEAQNVCVIDSSTGNLASSWETRSQVTEFRWSPDGKKLSYIEYEDVIRILDAKTGKVLTAHNTKSDHIKLMMWSPDAQRIAYLDYNASRIQIWDINTEQTVASYEIHRKIVDFAWSPDGQRIALIVDTKASLSGKNYCRNLSEPHLIAEVWSVESIPSLTWRLSDMDSLDIHWSSTGNFIVVQTSSLLNLPWDDRELEYQIQIWGPDQGNKRYTYMGGHLLRSLSWSPDDTHLAFIDKGHGIRVWNAVTGQVAFTHITKDDTSHFAWSPDSKYLASVGGESSTICIWHALGNGNTRYYRGHTGKVHAFTWSPDGKHIASVADENNTAVIHIWDTATLQTSKVLRQHSTTRKNGLINAISWSPNGKFLSCSFPDSSRHRTHAVDIWDATTGTYLFTHIGDWIWSPDGTRVVCRTREAIIETLDIP